MRKWVPLWALPLLAVFATGTVWLRLTLVRTTYKINQAEKDIRTLKRERDQAELRLAGGRSPRRLEVLARTRYHLAPPRADQVVHLR